MSALSLAVLLQLAGDPHCSAPGIQPHLAAALVKQESGGNALALHDDDARESLYPESPEDAARIIAQRWAAGHSVGVGLTQLTARSEAQFESKFGMTVWTALDACANLLAGSRHLLRAALSVFNSGTPGGAPGYAASVEAIAAQFSENPPTSSAHPAVVVPAPTFTPRRGPVDILSYRHKHAETADKPEVEE